MRVVYMAREYPPDVYGGAGVHLEHLAREMARLAQVEVKCFGDHPVTGDNPVILRYPHDGALFAANPELSRDALATLQTGLRFAALPVAADVVHCHTWYSHLGGVLAKLAYGVPLVVTLHSLEPLRPWKREQLGRGYDISCWVERTALEMADAVIAVSRSEGEEVLRRFDVPPERLHVVPNGVDTSVYRKVDGTAVLRKHDIDPGHPFVLFVGRISRQKGILHFLRAAEQLAPEVGVVLVAASPDAPGLEGEVESAVEALRRHRTGVTWLRTMLPRDETIALYSEAAVFCCPSVYEPFGIINLEAMACETPVVGTAVGGIRETVVPEETGLLVDLGPRDETGTEPADPGRLAEDLAAAMSRLIDDPDRRAELGRRGRRRVVETYGWDRIAAQVHEIYRQVKGEPAEAGKALPAERPRRGKERR
ncbi:MAG: glycogen synthase [Acidobacteriota bacterium]|jgi:glycogen synthase